MWLRPAAIAFTFLALLAACVTGPAGTGSSASTSAVGSSPETACRDESLEHFLSRFETDVALQKQTTSDPLKYGSIDISAQPEPRMVMQRLPHHQIEFPLYPSAHAQAERGLVRSIRKVGDVGAKVTLRKPDTDYQLVFHFQRDGCWTLTRKIDESL